MKLLTKEIEKRMPAMYATESVSMSNKVLQVKFFTPWSNWTWYGVEYDPVDRIFFGYVEGLEREWGNFSLDELEQVTGPIGLKIERDTSWTPKTFSEYQKVR